MRFRAALALLAVLSFAAPACSRGDFFRQHEYEEEIFLSLDGSATVYVNSSVAALDALRGAQFDTRNGAQIDRDAVRQFFTSPVTTIIRTPSLSRRSGRRFVHVQLEVSSLEQLSQASPFAWSAYKIARDGELVTVTQRVGPSAGRDVGDVGWTGKETVSFRAHLPSTVIYHNAGADGLQRGNILVWEQSLTDRLKGEPLEMEARMEAQSILSRTLLLFGGTVLVVAAMFAVIIWMVLRRGRRTSR